MSSLLGLAGLGGGAIGKAIVQLELDSAKYTAEMNAAKSQTIAGTRSMSSSYSKFSTLAQTAFLAIGAAAIAGLAQSVKAALEAEEAHQKLLNTVQNAAQLSQDSVAAFENQAEAIRSITGADDEAIISGQALLGQMGLTEDQILTLTPLVVDLSEKLNIDMNTAFKAVGKAAQGNTGTLARYVGTIKTGSNATETFTNVTEALGKAQGFAAQQAQNEPWRVLNSDMEEISEQIGKALLPAIRSLAESLLKITPLIETVAKGIQFLPLIQMAEDIGSADNTVTKLTNAMIDSIPVLGHYVDVGLGADATFHGLAGAVEDAATQLPGFTSAMDQAAGAAKRAGDDVVGTGKAINRFAHMSAADLHKWQEDTGESFDNFVLSLDTVGEQTRITHKQFREAIQGMRQNARDLNQAMTRLADDSMDWVPDEFITFLSEQGPEWLISFATDTENAQERAVRAWRKSRDATDESKTSLEEVSTALDAIKNTDAKGTVTIEYKYVGFDPSKPGMPPGGPGSKQQR